MEGTWQTGPITLEETEATVRRHGLGRYVNDYRENAPFIGATVLTLTIVVFHHSEGSNTYRWLVDHDTLTLHFVQSTLPGYRGDPGRGIPACAVYDRGVHEAGLTQRW